MSWPDVETIKNMVQLSHTDLTISQWWGILNRRDSVYCCRHKEVGRSFSLGVFGRGDGDGVNLVARRGAKARLVTHRLPSALNGFVL